MSSSILERVRQELQASADEKTKAGFQRFFKENLLCYGVKTDTVNKIAKKYWSEIKGSSKKEVFVLCEELFRSGYTEEAFVASAWLPNLAAQFETADLETFRRWIEQYVDNWAKCDSFCNHTVGDYFEKYPEKVGELKKWAKSPNRWLKRASAVSLIVPAKQGKFLQDAFEISDLLLADADDLVQKGYGWLLKEESRKHPTEVFDYVMRNRGVMPRTALRYAIELMPKELKAEAMKKN
jgi:3-methyladenine DNA glycosylase AlkD